MSLCCNFGFLIAIKIYFLLLPFRRLQLFSMHQLTLLIRSMVSNRLRGLQLLPILILWTQACSTIPLVTHLRLTIMEVSCSFKSAAYVYACLDQIVVSLQAHILFFSSCGMQVSMDHLLMTGIGMEGRREWKCLM